MRALMLAALACLIAGPAGAQIEDFNRALIENHFARDMPIYVKFIDDMRDGCLPRPKAIESAMELGVQRAGLKLGKRESSSWVLGVVAYGDELKFANRRHSGSCTFVVRAMFARGSMFIDVTDNKDEMLLLVEALSAMSRVGIADKAGAQDDIKSVVSDIVDGFANEILKATAK